MSCYFLIISSQQPDDDKITQLKSRISSEDFQNNIKKKYQINDINYCLLIDNPESTETFYYDWSSDLSACPEKLLQTKTIPINISARYIAANIHFLCNKISKDYQFIKALLFLKKEFYEDALSTTYILEAIYRLEEIYGACIVFYNGGEEVPYPFDKYNLNDPTNIFHINYLKSHCSLVYYNKKEKSCTNLCPFLNLSTNIDEPEFHLLRNIFYFLSFVEESNIPLCILQENYFQLTFCSDCAVKPSQNFKNSFSFKQAFIFKCLFMDKNQNFGDWTSNMTVIWQRNMALISDQLSGHVISPIHSSIKYAIAYPDEVSLSFNCYFVNTEILPQLSRLILADIDLDEYWKIFDNCSFELIKEHNEKLHSCKNQINKNATAQRNKNLNFSDVLKNNQDQKQDTTKEDIPVLSQDSSTKNIKPDKPLHASHFVKVESNLRLIIDKVLERKYKIASDNEIYKSCFRKLQLITKTYIKDLKTTRNLLETMVRIVKENAKQVVTFELENHSLTPKK